MLFKQLPNIEGVRAITLLLSKNLAVANWLTVKTVSRKA